MARHLHLVSPDAPSLTGPVIAAEAQAADTIVTIALLDGAPAPAVPPEVSVVVVEGGDAGYAVLLEMIFASDQVTAW
jgi:hypothetical protein